jgi:two-component system, OmpR family, sensor kinase
VTLRTRLLVSLGALVAIALLVAGALVVQFTRQNLVAQVDERLVEAAGRVGRGPGPGPDRGDDFTGRQFAYVLVGPAGRVIDSIACGSPGDPDPLPDLPSPRAATTALNRVFETGAVDGDLRYRVVLQRFGAGSYLALGAPLDDVDASMGALVRNLVLVGGGILAAVLVVAFLLIRRAMRPLERIATTADTIARGDLSHRTDLPRDRSEVGRLGSAFDQMLDQIQAAFEDQERSLAAKERSEARLRQFVADASHELRTPLTALRGYADLYRAGGLADDEAIERAMQRIGTESRRMGGLVEDLLLLARLDQGRPLRREPVDLSQLVEDAVADARAIEPDRPIRAEVGPGFRVSGDEDRLRQVVGNLFANVRVHTPPGTAVDVALERTPDGFAILRVADHGPGIDPGNAERVFDRFFRADPGRSRDRGGSGLGLSIAASVVEAHGGKVRHVPTPGGGATFEVAIPVEGRATPPEAG